MDQSANQTDSAQTLPPPAIVPTYFVALDANGVPTAFIVLDSSQPAPSGATSIDRATYDALGSGKYAFVSGALQPYTAPANYVSTDQIDAERDRRMYGGFVFQSEVFQTDATSIANITGAAQLAFMAIVTNGAKAGDYSWAGGSSDFAWIATDNTLVKMDAPTVIAFSKAAAAFRSQMIYAARMAKNALAAGQSVDVTADATWGVDSSSPTSTAPKSSPTGPTGTSASS